MKRFAAHFLALIAVLLLSANAHAAYVFLDDFSEGNGTLLHTKAPDLGGSNWNVTSGFATLDIQSGELDTDGISDVRAYVDFSQALAAGETLLMTLVFENTAGDFLSADGWAGISLYAGGTQEVLVGGHGTGFLTLREIDASWHDTTVATEQSTVTLEYIYDTGFAGLYSGVGNGGPLLTSYAGETSLALDEIRIANGMFTAYADLNLSSISVDVVPEPSTAILLGLGLLGLASRRRSN